ncbi:glycosyltransferase family 4 protein [Clostridium sp. Cult2]|uniref:glycosyltransferase family 4 protein n=1 Tax=Clostridium sp. Cult2 TaxID=2079003 RepID=UPI001F3A0B09|nr:glycosyltransferase family 4 protein [Clostridium sp. Cult2]MCF6465103.1 glycosyltransferase WbuB [Clostridium sp. Cult2]
MRKNIWIINHYGEPPTIGKYTRHFQFALELIKRGYDVRIFSSSAIHRTNINYINDNSKFIIKEIEGVPFVFVKTSNYEGNGVKRIMNMLEYAIRVIQVRKKFCNPDIIYASSPHPLTWLAGYRLAKRYNAKFIAETRDLWPETLVAMGAISKHSIPAKILYKLEKFIYKKADKLIFTFPGGKDYVDNIGLDISKVRYINNGVDLEEYDNNKQTYILRDTDLDNDKTFKIIYTGSMGQANSLNFLIEAAEIIDEKGIKDIKLILYGDGYQKEEMMNYVRDNNISNVIFKGRVEKKCIPNILSKSNLNIFTGKHIYLYKYGLSLNKMFEYFASGKPTLSNIECGYDMLEEYNCGLTVKGGSAEALAEGILKFYIMPKEEYNKYCENALKAAEDFDFKVLTDKLEKIILELESTDKEHSCNK